MPNDMPKRTIAIDIDDVIADTNGTMRDWINRKTGKALTSDDFSIEGEYWGYYERIWELHDITHLTFDEFESELIQDQAHVPLLAGAAFAIKQLAQAYKIILITSRSPSLEVATRRWLAEHLDVEVELYFARNNRNAEGKSKGELCVELGATLLIDDNVDHVQSAIDNGVAAILFGNYGWQSTFPNEAKRFEQWSDIVEYLHG
jgi:FMN phosphatase YigB (HAD superfamily)